MKRKIIILSLSLLAIFSTPLSVNAFYANDEIWEMNDGVTEIGYLMGSLNIGDGGKLEFNGGFSCSSRFNIFLHGKPIENFLKIGLIYGPQLNYATLKKTPGDMNSLASDPIYNPEVGKQFLTAGLAIGPSLTFKPFADSDKINAASLGVRLFFNVIPSYSGIFLNEEKTRYRNTFSCLLSAGGHILVRHMSLGLEWRGGSGRYNHLFNDYDKKAKITSNMFSITIGVAL